MTKFNQKGSETPTLGELLEPAMKITSKKDAEQYLNEYVLFIEKDLIAKGKEEDAKEKALMMAKDNIGYFAGYYSEDVRRRIEDLFECKHPIFGSIKENGIPTAKEAFALGEEWAKKSKLNKKG